MKAHNSVSGNKASWVFIEEILSMTEFCIEDIYSDMSEAMEKIAADDNGAVLVNPGREADFPESLTSYLQAFPKGSCHSVFLWDNDNRHVLRLKLKGDHPSDNTDSTLDKKEINRDNEIPALPNAPIASEDGENTDTRLKPAVGATCTFFKSGTDFIKINFQDILFFQSEHVYVNILLLGRKVPLRTKLDHVESFISDHGFCRIHQRYIVNISNIDRVTSESVYIGNYELPLSKKFKKALLEKVGVFM
ncbi:MAG: LytTR family transcriptional regulator [Saprospiraceae bacterium]|nr:LytTR family transcriptional regulator [Candidatus Parvibacillus calidus]